MKNKLTNYGIILASGAGNRFGGEVPKQFTKICGKTVLEYTTEVFERSDLIDKIIIVVIPEYIEYTKKIIIQNNYQKIIKVLCGGETRKDSSYIGVSAIEEDEANVLIHDCARPFITEEILENSIDALNTCNAIAVSVPSRDTVFEVKENKIISIPERSNLMLAQTPQGFKLSLIRKAHEISKGDKCFTDDCGLVVKYGLDDVYIIQGNMQNIKITYPEDIYFAESIVKAREYD